MKSQMMKHGLYSLLIASTSLMAPAAFAQDSVVSLEEAIKSSKVLADFRLRYEGADFDGVSNDAVALTYRARVGFETGAWASTKLLVEFDHVQALVDDFNSTINGNTTYPVIADPDVTELNRFQLTNTALPGTTVTIGRQRIVQDDSRFIGNVGWRQNEQTYDAVRIVNKSVENLTLDATYIDQVNRIFGDDSPGGRFDSDSWVLNAGYNVPMDGAKLKLSGYAYLLDLSNAGLSSQTIGASAAFKKGILGLKGAYAVQSDYGNQPVNYDADYYFLEASLAKNGLSGAVGYEVLGSDGGVKAFTTPLATLHKFNGFADVFLGTPAGGLEDIYVKAGYKTKAVGILPFVNMFAVYHDFSADSGSADYGSEIDAVVATKIGKTGVLFKYANYDADAFATTRARYSLQFDYKF